MEKKAAAENIRQNLRSAQLEPACAVPLLIAGRLRMRDSVHRQDSHGAVHAGIQRIDGIHIRSKARKQKVRGLPSSFRLLLLLHKPGLRMLQYFPDKSHLLIALNRVFHTEKQRHIRLIFHRGNEEFPHSVPSVFCLLPALFHRLRQKQRLSACKAARKNRKILQVLSIDRITENNFPFPAPLLKNGRAFILF